MKIIIDFSVHDAPCDLCGWLDDSGGVQLVDDQQVSKVVCHQCTLDLVRACLPDSRYVWLFKPDQEPNALALAGA